MLLLFRGAILCAAIAVTIVFLIYTHESKADQAADWLQGFYDDRGVCVSSTSVSEINSTDTQLLVNLNVESDYLQRVKKGGSQMMTDWLALHCPLPMIAYENVFNGRDILIKVPGTTELSCRSYEANR